MAYQQGPPGGGYLPAYQKQQQPAGYPPQPGQTTIIVQQQPKVITQPVVRSVSQIVIRVYVVSLRRVVLSLHNLYEGTFKQTELSLKHSMDS